MSAIAAAAMAAGSREAVGDSPNLTVPAPAGPSSWVAPEGATVLWDNGPVVTNPGGGFGGADLSLLESTTLGMTTFGAANQGNLTDGGNRMADDFVIPAGEEWSIRSCTFYSYQTSSPTDPSPISAATLAIWDGAPEQPGSTMVFGDQLTDRLVDAPWANLFRAEEPAPTSNARAVFAVTVDVNAVLPEGTYFVDYAPVGSGAFSGPWAPPVTRTSQTTTGDALQRFGGTWQAFQDGGTLTALGLPFICEGEVLVGVNPLEVPTSGHIGLGLLAVLLAAAAVVAMRRLV
jgi:hypothetical protein